MGFSIPKWIKEPEGEASLLFPALTIFFLFGCIYIIENRIPGSFYAVIAALLGARALCVFQARCPPEAWLVAPLQRLVRLLGFGADADDDVDDGQDGRPQTVADSRSSSAAAWLISGEQKDDADPSLDENNSSRNGGQGSYIVGDIDSSATQERHLLDIDDNGADGLLGDSDALMGDWFENMNSQERAAAEAGAHVAMAEDVEKTDPVDKARLDLLFRYLASMEGGNKDQAQAPASAQRQKLQRKLLLRTAGLGDNSKATKNVVKAENSESAGQDVERGAGKVEDLLEDSVKIEALLRELGEDSSKLNSASLPKAPTKAKKAKPMPRRKGAATSAPTRGSSKEELISVCSKAPFASASRPSPDLEKADAIEVGLGPTDSPAQAEMSLEEAAEFEVVANRKARRKGRKESDVVVPEAPRSRTSSAETLQPPNAAGPKSSAVPAVVQNVSTEVPTKLAGQAKAATVAQPSKAVGIAKQVQDPGAAGEQSVAITASIAEPVAITASIAELAMPPIATFTAAKLNQAAAEAMTVAGPSTITSTKSPNAPAAHPSKERPTNEEDEANVKGEFASSLPEDAEDEEDWGEDGEDWEWQCPDGFPLQEHICETPTLCGSCGEMQPQGSAMQLAIGSGWAACEECINIAFNQPVEATGLPQAGMLAVDPSRMTALEIATWFQDRGAESDLRQCMLQIMAAEVESSKASSTQEVVSPTPN